MSELKPCPFCGSEDILEQDHGMGIPYMLCNNCHARGPRSFAPALQWNTRAESAELAALREQVKMLREALENVRLTLSENKLITGICTCGAPIVGHGAWSYHTPKDTGKLVIAEAIAAINLALAKAVK